MKPYNKSNIPLAKNLRKNMTPWERKLWYEYLRYYPVRFQRQKAIGNYIVDFYCAKARLVIELDGGGHYTPEQAQQDTLRTQQLQSMQLTVLRICNLDIDKNFAGVCEFIDNMVKETLPQSAPLTAPSTEGAGESVKTIYALGFFDGVHLGHQALLSACLRLARETGAKAGAVTFATHPEQVICKAAPRLINTSAQRERLLRGYGMERVIQLPFDETLMKTHWSDFLQQLIQLGAAGFVCGSDFRFGAGGSGTAKKLQAFCQNRGLPCCVVPQQLLENIRVSSSHIRSLLEAGDVRRAADFLGHRHSFCATVIPGKQLGRTVGIPTANLAYPQELVRLPYGVYACKALVEGKEYAAVTNIGTRPTVNGQGVLLESWLLEFDGDLYGKELTVVFYQFLRPEKKFPDLDTLKEEILKNAAQTRKILEKS